MDGDDIAAPRSTDRTALFTTLAEEQRLRASVPRPPARLAPRSLLERAFADLASRTRAAEARVARLVRLAQRRGLFDDPAAEINELTVTVKADIAALESALRPLLTEVARQPSGDARRGGVAAGSTPPAVSPASPRAHWGIVAEAMRTRALAVASAFADALRSRSSNMRAAAERRRGLARSTWAPSATHLNSPLFSNAAQGGAEAGADALGAGAVAAEWVSGAAAAVTAAAGVAQHAHAPRGQGAAHAPLPWPRPLHAAPHAPSGTGPSAYGAPYTGSYNGAHRGAGDGAYPHAPTPTGAASSTDSGGLRRRPPPTAASGGGFDPYGPAATAAAPPPPRSAYAPVLYPVGAYTYTQAAAAAYGGAQARASEMASVEASIVEIGHMFTRMAALVEEQGEVAERIDADMDVAGAAISAGHDELLAFYGAASKNRGFILKVLCVMVLVVLLFAATRRGGT